MSLFRSRRTVDEAAARIARARVADLGSARARLSAPTERPTRSGWIPPAPPAATPTPAEPDPLGEAVRRYWQWEEEPRTSSPHRSGRHRARASPVDLEAVGRRLQSPDLPEPAAGDVPPTGHEPATGADAGPIVRVGIGRPHLVAVVLALVVGLVVTAATALASRPETEPIEPNVVAGGTPLPGSEEAGGSDDPTDSDNDGDKGSGTGDIVVHVAGKVAAPGVLTLPSGSRVVDAIDAAGGAESGVDLAPLNLARVLTDGEQVLVGVEAPPPPPGGGSGGGGSAGGTGGLVDLNSATAADLDTLPGIGPTLAQRILDWRTENGRFSAVEELREVTGIGERTFADLEPLVTV